MKVKIDTDIPLPDDKYSSLNFWKKQLGMMQPGHSFVVSDSKRTAIRDAANVMRYKIVTRLIDSENGLIRVWVLGRGDGASVPLEV